MGYIYKIQNKINSKVYIGQTRKHYIERWKQHIKGAQTKKKKTYIQQAIAKYGIENFVFSVIEEVPNSMLDEREIFWIEQENSFKNGYNRTIGGNGVLFQQQYDYEAIYEDWCNTHNLLKTAEHFKCSRDTVRSAVLCHNVVPRDVYLSDSHTQYDYEQIALDYQKIQNIRKVANKYKCDVKVVSNACRKFNIPVLSSGETTQKEIGLPVQQIDLQTMLIINTFPSACFAAQQITGDKTKGGNIIACCRHKQKTAYGYGWIFKGESIPNNLLKNNRWRKVLQIDIETNEILNKFNSGMEAARSLNKGESAAGVILRVCRHEKNLKTAYGFKWEYGD